MKNQLEFYNTPSGYVMYDDGQKTSLLSESSRDVVDDILDTIRECYSDAYRALDKCYSKASKNPRFKNYKMVHRFLRCNCGEFDTQKIDFIDGNINLEQVQSETNFSSWCKTNADSCSTG